jgi:DNA gyrase subunit A
VHAIPQGGKLARGKNIANLLELSAEEKITAFVPAKKFDDEHFIVMATKNGTIKKTVLSSFANPRKGGINAMDLPEDDEVIDVGVSDGTNEIILATHHGLACRFHEEHVRSMGRSAYGVRGVSLEEGDRVVSMVVVKRASALLTVCENGYGKRSEISEYRLTNRGGKGVINIKTTDRNGPRGGREGSRRRRRTHDHLSPGDYHPHVALQHPSHGPRHTGCASNQPR